MPHRGGEATARRWVRRRAVRDKEWVRRMLMP